MFSGKKYFQFLSQLFRYFFLRSQIYRICVHGLNDSPEFTFTRAFIEVRSFQICIFFFFDEKEKIHRFGKNAS